MRLLNRLLALIVALALAAGGILLILEVVAAGLHKPHVLLDWGRAYRWAHTTAWASGSVRVVSYALIAVGVVLLVLQLLPRRPGRMRMAGGSPLTDTAMTRRGLAASLFTVVRSVDGVRAASVKVSRRRIAVVAESAARDEGLAAALNEPVTAAARGRIEALQLADAPRLSVTVRPRSA